MLIDAFAIGARTSSTGALLGTASAIALICAAAVIILKGLGFGGVRLVSAAAITVILSLSVSPMVAALGVAESLGEGISGYSEAAIKTVGIGYLSGIVADICKELDEGGMAKAVGIAAKAEIILIALPFMEEIASLAAELLSGG